MLVDLADGDLDQLQLEIDDTDRVQPCYDEAYTEHHRLETKHE